MKVTKKTTNVSFNVSGPYSESWFSGGKIDRWEQNTFHILEKYSDNDKGVYVDIGAWIGPTVLYAANKYNHVVAIEPDPAALNMLEQNLRSNNFSNISLIKKALSSGDGKIQFGANGSFGNSESTMLVSDTAFLEEGWGDSNWSKYNQVIEVETTSMENIVKNNNINPENINLMKMDIEGGEYLVIPHLKSFLEKYKPAFYIELHYFWLNKEQVNSVLDTLFSIYNSCYNFDAEGNREKITKEVAIKSKINNLVFSEE